MVNRYRPLSALSGCPEPLETIQTRHVLSSPLLYISVIQHQKGGAQLIPTASMKILQSVMGWAPQYR